MALSFSPSELSAAEPETADDHADGVTRTLAEFVDNNRLPDIPQASRDEGVRSIVNYVGCAIGGATHETTTRAITALSPFFGPAQATIFGRSEQADILNAALINGIASHVLDYDDTQLSTIIHPAGPVCSAIFPLAEWKGLSGEALLHAFILGVEVECRIGKSVYPSHYQAGWHITGTAGVFGAAAAAGKLLGLNVQQMVWALGIAATQSSGFKEMFGTMCKPLHPGQAARNGLTAALLAQQNFTSTDAAIEGEQSFANVMASSRDYSKITENLGRTWEIDENTYKPFACGIVIHSIIDACRRLRNEHQFQPGEIERVDLKVNHYAISLTGNKEPRTGLESKFSIYHAVAATLIHGAAGPRQFTDEVAQNDDVIALRSKVHAEISPNISEEQAEATITLRDGRILHQRIEHAFGSSENPMKNADLEEKFRDLANGVLQEPQISDVLKTCWNIASLKQVKRLTQAAVPRMP